MTAAALVAQLAAAGTPPELLAAVAQELFTAEAERRILAERRENERARKAKSREVTGQDVTARDEPGHEPQKEKAPRPRKEKPTPLNGSLKGEPIPPQPELLPEHVLEAWNAMADRTGLPKVKKLEGARGKKLVSLMRNATVDDFTEAIDAIERAPWMHGANDRGWRADFDFLITPAKFTKLIEGSYDRAAH